MNAVAQWRRRVRVMAVAVVMAYVVLVAVAVLSCVHVERGSLVVATENYALTMTDLAAARRAGLLTDAQADEVTRLSGEARASLEQWRIRLAEAVPTARAEATFGEALSDLQSLLKEAENTHAD